jgi:hypothetical protein
MASALTKISSVTVGSGGSASISFTSIPQTYTDLVVKISGRTNRTADVDSIAMTFNGSSTGITWRTLMGDGSTATSGTAQRLWVNSTTYTANTFGNAEVYIPNYTSANYKSTSIDLVTENNATGAYAEILTQLWSNTAAVTSIELAPQFGTGWLQYTTATLYGVTKYAETGTGSKAIGGTVTTSGSYTIHTFYSSGVFTPTANLTADYLVVAGGGGGGGLYYGGSGGGGGLRSTVTATGGGGTLETALSLTSGTGYSVVIGAGGSGGGSTIDGSPGTNSSFSSIVSTGGGLGRTEGGGLAGIGGSGAGGCPSATVAYRAGGAGTTNQGYAGGSAAGDGSTFGSGGGGGAGGVGGNNASTVGGDGGIGVATSINGTSTYYAGGAGGQSYSGPVGSPGAGGGGRGALGSAGIQATPGFTNTGGGGGGGSHTAGSATNGKPGGSGIVIIRYTT